MLSGHPASSARALDMSPERNPRMPQLMLHQIRAADKTAPLLAKLTLPRLFSAVPRERLFRVLDQRRFHPLVWISGPPGYGKTTLVASYIESRQPAALWYRMDAGDADPATFFHYLAQASAQADDAKQAPLPTLTREHAADLSGFSRRFFRELYSRLPRPAVLVLDDYQKVACEIGLHAMLADSAQEIPVGVNVVIVSASQPPSAYSRIIANKTVSRVDGSELRLTLEETRSIACATHPMDESVVSTLHRQSDGWATGLTLMLERVRRIGVTARQVEAESREAVFIYFDGEILDKAPPEHRQILLASAFLPRMTPSAAAAISGHSSAARVLADLHQRQLFVSRSPGSQPSYQYHDLLRQFLLARAEELYSPSEVHDLARRAARILEADGQIEDAIALYQRAQDWQCATTLILREAPSLLAQGRGQALRQRLSGLPPEHLASHPWLIYWRGMSLLQVDRPAARRTLEQAFAGLQADGDEIGKMLAVTGIVEASNFDWSDFHALDPWIDVLDQLLARNPIFPSPEVQLRVHAAMLTALLRRKPDHPLLSVCVQRVSDLLEVDLAADARINAASALMTYHYYANSLDSERLQAISGTVRSLLAAHVDVRPFNRMFWLLQLAACLSFELRKEEALAALAEASAMYASNDLAITEGCLSLVRHLIYFALSERSAMQENMEVLKSVIDPLRSLEMGALQHALADHATTQDRAGLAVTHLQSAVAFADESGSRPDQARSRIFLAASLVTDRRVDEAVEHLDAARVLVSGTSLHLMSRDVNLVEASVALHRNQTERCRAALEGVLHACDGRGCVSQLLIFHPALMSGLCAEALRLGIRPEYVKQLIHRYRLAPMSADLEEWPWPIKVFTLGGFKVLRNGTEIRFARKAPKRPLELLQALIALGGSEVAVSTLTETLWPDAEGDSAYHAFENALSRLRQLLGTTGALVLSGGKLSLDSKQCWVDVWALERRLGQIREANPQATQAFEATLDLYRGHFLDQEGQPWWTLPMRERLRQKFARLIRDAAQSFSRVNAWGEAAAIYQRGIELDYLDEDLYRGLMVCHRQLGNHGEALRVYRRCRELLSIVLGVQPGAQTQAAYQSLTSLD